MFCVGLTGTIASGKSTVSAEFAKLGAEVIDADKIAKALTLKASPVFTDIINHFGDNFVKTDGELNRSKLRQLIINNPEEKNWLEQLLHPLIRQEIERQIKTSSSKYCIIDIPLLNDKAAYPYLNRVLLVKSTPELQISRIIARDGCSIEDAQRILNTQEEENTRHLIADDIIDNKSSLADLVGKVGELHEKYISQL